MTAVAEEMKLKLAELPVADRAEIARFLMGSLDEPSVDSAATFHPDNLEELSKAGRAIYEERLKSQLEPELNGKVVAIHIETGDYEVGANSPSAWKSLKRRQPVGPIAVLDIGPAAEDSMTRRMLGTQFATGKIK